MVTMGTTGTASAVKTWNAASAPEFARHESGKYQRYAECEDWQETDSQCRYTKQRQTQTSKGWG